MSALSRVAVASGVAVVAPDVARGLECQTRPPDEICTGPDGLRRACASGARWVWLLADGGDPRADALERLLEARAPAGASPAAIVAGVVIGPDGRIEEHRLPGWEIRHPALVALVQRHVLPVRHATLANCLVARECFDRYGWPDERRLGAFAGVEWTARVLRERSGYFTPASVVHARPDAGRRDTRSSLPALARMLRSGTWTRGEQVAHVRRLVAGHRRRRAP